MKYNFIYLYFVLSFHFQFHIESIFYYTIGIGYLHPHSTHCSVSLYCTQCIYVQYTVLLYFSHFNFILNYIFFFFLFYFNYIPLRTRHYEYMNIINILYYMSTNWLTDWLDCKSMHYTSLAARCTTLYMPMSMAD